MPTGFSRSPLLIKGALIEFSDRFIGPVPNIIIFQYNPETMTRNLEVWNPDNGGASTSGNRTTGNAEVSHTAQPDDPPESFDLALELDATDDLETPEFHRVAFVSGVANRIAAMEMLLYPQTRLFGGMRSSETGSLAGAAGAITGAAGGASGGITGAAAGGSIGAQPIPRGTVPVVLFVWGPGRIVPVRLTSFSVEEQAYSPTLYPLRAKVSVRMKVLAPKDFPSCHRRPSEDLAIAAFKFNRKQKETLAATNMANDIDSIWNSIRSLL